MMNTINLKEPVLNLIRLASTDLPGDIELGLKQARTNEKEEAALFALESILKNVSMAREKQIPMCQDTGLPIFHVYYPNGTSMLAVKEEILTAVRKATKNGYLRPNAVDAVTGENSGNNTGCDHFPLFHFNEWEKPHLQITLMLKGGGSENVSCQYTLPDSSLMAARDLAGVRRVVLDAVNKAQGKGCPPGILGIGIGGDRASSYEVAKESLLRKLDEPNPVPELDLFERKLTDEINSMGIGPMGFGGHTTVLGVKAKACHRLPACFFVSIAYMCWACRRWSLSMDGEKVEYFS